MLEIKYHIRAVYTSSNGNTNYSCWTCYYTWGGFIIPIVIYMGTNADSNGTCLVISSCVQEVIFLHAKPRIPGGETSSFHTKDGISQEFPAELPTGGCRKTWWLVNIDSCNGLMRSNKMPFWLSQCWARSISPYGVILPQCVDNSSEWIAT